MIIILLFVYVCVCVCYFILFKVYIWVIHSLQVPPPSTPLVIPILSPLITRTDLIMPANGLINSSMMAVKLASELTHNDIPNLGLTHQNARKQLFQLLLWRLIKTHSLTPLPHSLTHSSPYVFLFWCVSHTAFGIQAHSCSNWVGLPRREAQVMAFLISKIWIHVRIFN